jgi:hypothetical protein
MAKAKSVSVWCVCHRRLITMHIIIPSYFTQDALWGGLKVVRRQVHMYTAKKRESLRAGQGDHWEGSERCEIRIAVHRHFRNRKQRGCWMRLGGVAVKRLGRCRGGSPRIAGGLGEFEGWTLPTVLLLRTSLSSDEPSVELERKFGGLVVWWFGGFAPHSLASLSPRSRSRSNSISHSLDGTEYHMSGRYSGEGKKC